MLGVHKALNLLERSVIQDLKGKTHHCTVNINSCPIPRTEVTSAYNTIYIPRIAAANSVGKTAEIIIRWAQKLTGIATPVLEDRKRLPHLEGGWVANLRDGLITSNAKIKATKPWTTAPQRAILKSRVAIRHNNLGRSTINPKDVLTKRRRMAGQPTVLRKMAKSRNTRCRNMEVLEQNHTTTMYRWEWPTKNKTRPVEESNKTLESVL
eukprot:1573523-Ditylum_brightwellii.AAC.1